MKVATHEVPAAWPRLSTRSRLTLGLVALGGAVAFLYGLAADRREGVWPALLVNFLFWAGIGHAGVAVSALFQITAARWGRPLKRLAEATCAFTPVSLVVLLVLLAGRASFLPWIGSAPEDVEWWFNTPFLVVRQLLGMLLLAGLSAAYVYASARPDVGMLYESGHRTHNRFSRGLITGWRGLDAERTLSQRWQRRLAPAVLIGYVCVFTLLAVDFVMALAPHWYSSALGSYFFVGNLYMGVAFLAVVGALARRAPTMDRYITTDCSNDLGNLLLAFCVLWVYVFWSQYLVIWYGDLPEEIDFVIRRTAAPWAGLSWMTLAGCFVVPFAGLLSRALKRHPYGVGAVALVVMAGMWLERFILVGPSLWGDAPPRFGLLETLITLGFAAAFTLCYTTLLDAVPVLPIADPLLEGGPRLETPRQADQMESR